MLHHKSQKSHLKTMKPGNKVDATRAGKRGDSLTEIRACIQNNEIRERVFINTVADDWGQICTPTFLRVDSLFSKGGGGGGALSAF